MICFYSFPVPGSNSHREQVALQIDPFIIANSDRLRTQPLRDQSLNTVENAGSDPSLRHQEFSGVQQEKENIPARRCTVA